MTEANLRPSWLSSCNIYCLKIGGGLYTIPGKKTAIHFAMLGAIYIGHSSMRHVHDLMKSQLYTYLGSEGGLVLPLSVAEFNGL